jgi:hypothetical protein
MRQAYGEGFYDLKNKDQNKKEVKLPCVTQNFCRPLLPSGPGGVEHYFVAQDLTPIFHCKLPEN